MNKQAKHVTGRKLKGYLTKIAEVKYSPRAKLPAREKKLLEREISREVG
jgi:hypothetical protein